MFKKILFLSIASYCAISIFYFSKSKNSNSNPQIRGVSTSNQQLTSNNEQQSSIKILLNNIAESYDMQKINIYDTSFKWIVNDKTLDLLGLGLAIENDYLNTVVLKNILSQNNFFITDYPYSDTAAYIKNGTICVVKDSITNDKNILDKIEIRCASFNPTK